ncbi:MAG: GIY-YIG nuclease family protein [Butyrivibrio sp.]|nr:GIY-YIG nuclease family protein [Butyrivibrio sp.]
MGKYIGLLKYLDSSSKDELCLSLKEIEQIIGDSLPNSAYKYPAFWANDKSRLHASSWLDAGYKVSGCRLKEERIFFSKAESEKLDEEKHVKKKIIKDYFLYGAAIHDSKPSTSIKICGYEFDFVQSIVPECDAKGRVIEYAPQDNYNNQKALKLHCYGEGTFCKFKINAPDAPGVYLWVVNEEIIYIGETDNLKRRFNTGYGVISARNCFEGGQTTNCKMNKVVLEYAKQNSFISLYFYKTNEYKKVELELLRVFNTKYNVKDNQ